MSAEWLTIVAPSSVESWLDRFRENQGPVQFVGESASDPVALAERLIAAAAGRGIRLLSGHDSLLRDWLVTRELVRRDLRVESQSGMAVAAGLDKVLQKELLGSSGIPTPTWSAGAARQAGGLIKARRGTQSRGLEWAGAEGEVNPSDTYWEEFVGGVEYSVVVHASSRGTTVFPPVWKGPVRNDLVPPWRRLRLVPSGLSPETEHLLRDTTLTIARLLDVWGFCEVEFIVPADGTPLVIDVNPRICGTMRIVAMATGVPIFDLPDGLEAGARVEATRFTGEIPYRGVPFVSDAVVATSRLTCVADCPQDVLGTLAAYGFDVEHETLPQVWHAD